MLAQVARRGALDPRATGAGARSRSTVTDGRTNYTLTFFGRQAGLARAELAPGAAGSSPARSASSSGSRQLAHPDYLLRGRRRDAGGRPTCAERLIPIYPAARASQRWTIAKAVGWSSTLLDDVPGPAAGRRPGPARLMRPRRRAARDPPPPDDRSDWRAARRRLRFDEAFALQLALAQRRARLRRVAGDAAAGRVAGGLLDAFDARLPFVLTDGQREVGGEIAPTWPRRTRCTGCCRARWGRARPWWRCARCCRSSTPAAQAALLAPTEVLAAAAPPVDHRRCSARSPRPGMLGGAEDGDPGRAADRLAVGRGPPRRRCSTPAPGTPGIVVGTHALLQDHVAVRRPRPGRGRRAAPLRRRAARRAARQGRRPPPHVLVMTATPIPRTVAMTVFGDLETSTLRELPAGPAPITHARGPAGEQPRWVDRGLAAHPRGGRRRPPGVRRLPADRRRPARPTSEGRTRRPGRPRTPTSARRPARAPWPKCSPSCADGPSWPACGSSCCTAGCRPRTKDRR